MKLLTSKIAPGDVFIIPAIDPNDRDGYVLARYISYVEPNVGNLIEVFGNFYPLNIELPINAELGSRLFRPIMCSLRFAEIPRWHILRSDPKYSNSNSAFSEIEIAFDSARWKGGKQCSSTKAELVGLEPSIVWRTHHIVFRIKYHLMGLFDTNECYDYHLVPVLERIDHPDARARIISCAKAVDHRLKRP